MKISVLGWSLEVEVTVSQSNGTFELIATPVHIPVYGTSRFGKRRFQLPGPYTQLLCGDPSPQFGPIVMYGPMLMALSLECVLELPSGDEKWALSCQGEPDLVSVYKLDEVDSRLRVFCKTDPAYFPSC